MTLLSDDQRTYAIPCFHVSDPKDTPQFLSFVFTPGVWLNLVIGYEASKSWRIDELWS